MEADKSRPKLSIVIPVDNERNTIEHVLWRVLVNVAVFVIDTAASLLLQRSDRVARILQSEIE